MTSPARSLYRLKIKKMMTDSDGKQVERVSYITFSHNVDQATALLKAKKLAVEVDSVEVMEAPLAFDSVIASYINRKPFVPKGERS